MNIATTIALTAVHTQRISARAAIAACELRTNLNSYMHEPAVRGGWTSGERQTLELAGQSFSAGPLALCWTFREDAGC